MKQAIIKLTYRHFIDIHSKSDYEKNVFDDSYEEFLMQSQTYNPQRSLSSFQELVDNNPKANSLHYKVGFSVGLYVQGLKNKMPELTDTLERSIKFLEHRFELIHSDINNKALHKVALYYISESMILLGVIGNNLLLGPVKSEDDATQETFLVPLQKNLSISSYQEIAD